jgi:hypothetical protein
MVLILSLEKGFPVLAFVNIDLIPRPFSPRLEDTNNGAGFDGYDGFDAGDDFHVPDTHSEAGLPEPNLEETLPPPTQFHRPSGQFERVYCATYGIYECAIDYATAVYP